MKPAQVKQAQTIISSRSLITIGGWPLDPIGNHNGTRVLDSSDAIKSLRLAGDVQHHALRTTKEIAGFLPD